MKTLMTIFLKKPKLNNKLIKYLSIIILKEIKP
jgi:hypothetical protein